MITNVDQIISQANIIEVVNILCGQVLKAEGQNYKACCPFHDEKSASFTVSPSKQIYKCFGCGEAGNVVKFVMEHERKTFPEAIAWIAGVSNIQVEYANNANQKELIAQNKSDYAQKERLHILNQNVWEALPKIKGFKKDKYDLDGREYAKQTIEAFAVKHYPNSNFILDNLEAKHWNKQDVNLLGLTKSGEHGEYDPLKNRIIFPIHNPQGKISGFGARVYKKDEPKKRAKYVNSADSLLYDKSSMLYGLYQNRKQIIEKEFTYLVEGYTDVMTLYDHGLQNAVATCGTSLTEKQAILLSKYTNRVIFIYDGDAAGQKAIRRSISILLKVKLDINIVVLPDKHDPDSYIRTFDADQFKKYVDETNQDAILWRVGDIMKDPEDGFQREAAINTCVELIAVIDSESMREFYIKKLTHNKWFGSIKRILVDKIKIIRDSKLNVNKRKKLLESEQTLDMMEYGIFEQNNCYYKGYSEDDSRQISNFVIQPVMHVRNAFFSKIIFDIMNTKGHSIIMDINTDVFASMDKFQNTLLSRGNYIFNAFCKKENYTNIIRKAYDKIDFAQMIELLGYNKKGFYVWGNGISHENKFHEVDEYGLVNIDNQKYYLPAFSKISIELEDFGQNTDYSFHKSFIYKKVHDVTFHTWTDLMTTVHGPKAMVGIAWFCAVLFRDWIYQQFRFFPHLNCFGPPGKGKSFFCWDFMYMFGVPTKPFAFKGGSHTAFYRMLMQRTNAIFWADEYDNDIHPKLIEGIKNSYDGGGRDLGTNTSRIQTITTDVNSALLFSGQQQPTKDNAMITRVISLNFDGKQITDQGRKAAEELKVLRASGQLTQITHYLLKYRSTIMEKWNEYFIEITAQVKAKITDIQVEDRILYNHVIPLVAVKALMSNTVSFAFNYEDLFEYMVQLIRSKTAIIGNEDEVSQWWGLVELLISTQKLQHEKNFVIQDITSLTILDDHKKPIKKTFPKPKKVLFLRLSDAHAQYSLLHRQTYNKSGLSKTDIQYYLKIKPSYIGYVKGKKMAGRTSGCVAFDMRYMPFDMETTEEFFNYKLKLDPEAVPEAAPVGEVEGEDMLF